MPEYDQLRRIVAELTEMRTALVLKIAKAQGYEKRAFEDLHRRVSKALSDLSGR